MDEQIRRLIAENARLSVEPGNLGDGDDLYRCGMSSHATVVLMISLEDHFGVEFPEDMLTRSTFGSIASIRAALEQLAVPAG